jgi:hypothetical protein
MPYQQYFYDNLPLYARLADEEKGLLKYLCDRAIQPEFDEIQGILEQQQYYYDPNNPVSWGHLDWLGQFVGLGIIEDHWLGVGINPDWQIAWKVDIINRAWQYWQIKGTSEGIREAVSMWLRFDDENRFLLKLPFGKNSAENNPGLWGYDTCYDDHVNKKYSERKFFAWGNYWGEYYRANYYSIQPPQTELWDYLDQWGDITLWDYIAPYETIQERSRLGDRELWMHFYLKEWEWNTILPDVFELNMEILPATTTATVFGWNEGTKKCICLPLERDEDYIKFQTFPIIELDGAQYGQLVNVGGIPVPQPFLFDTEEYYVYGGTIYPYPPRSEYTTLESVIVTTEWGIWEPEYWDGAWWGTLLSDSLSPTTETFTIDVEELGEINTLSIETLIIDISELNFINLGSPEVWYVPWGTFTYSVLQEVTYPAIPCIQGIPYYEDEGTTQLQIDLGVPLYSRTNQLVEIVDDEYVLTSPVEIATYFTIYNEGYIYYYNSSNLEPFILNVPVLTSSIEVGWDALETFQAPNDMTNYYCNVFAGFSSLTVLSQEYRTIQITKDYTVLDLYPILAKAIVGDNWTLMLETGEEIFFLKPVTMFWYASDDDLLETEFNKGTAKRSQSFDFHSRMTTLYLEFVFRPKGVDTKIDYAALSLNGDLVENRYFYYSLDVAEEGFVGLVFKIPFRLPSSLDTPEEEVLLEEILPMLTQELRALAGLPQTSLMPGVFNPKPTLDCCMENETLRDILISLRDAIKAQRSSGDKYYEYIIDQPALYLLIAHNLKKNPSVTFVDTITAIGRKSQPTVDYIDINTVKISFSEPTIGRVFFN